MANPKKADAVEITDGSNLDPEANKSTHQRYLESLVDGAPVAGPVEGRDFTGDENDTSAYVGVNPEYRNYASETEKPFRAEEGTALREVEDSIVVPDEGLMYATLSGEAYKETAEANRKEAAEAAEAQAKENAAGGATDPSVPTASSTDGGTPTASTETF